MGFELGTGGPNVIVAGVDGSRTSLRAGAYAAGLARRQGARLVVVHVVTAPAYSQLVPEAAGAALAAAAYGADDTAAEVRRCVERIGVGVDLRTASGDPYTELSRICDQVRADMVVVGASTGLGHRLIGSVAVRLVKAGRWPVTVVP